MYPKLSLLLMIINILLGVTIILRSGRRPSANWAWIMILFVLPFFGLVVYFTFGIEGSRYAAFVKKHKADQNINYQKNTNKNSLKTVETNYMGLSNLNLNMSQSPITTDNIIKIYHEGQGKFQDLINDIKKAKKSIHIQYYIMKNDELGRHIINALTNKAKEGVEVRLLIDKLGSKFLSRKMLKSLTEATGFVAQFAAPHIMRLNFRNHRKISIIDGTIGYIGGFNIGNEYLGKGRYNYWRDCHLRITGSAVEQLQLRFARDFNYSSKIGKISDINNYLKKQSNNTPGVKLQIVSSGPDTKYNSILYAYIKMIVDAKKYVYIQTPYFIPHESIQDALIMACKSGVDVKIMIPAAPDVPFVYWAALGYMGDLIKAGAKCYKYEKGFVHSKLVIVDGETASVGTANMDIRSLKLNFEINAFLFDATQVKILENQFIDDVKNCTTLDYEWYNRRKIKDRIREAICVLISPIL